MIKTSGLQDNEERYQALFDRSIDCVYILDFDGRFIDANNAALNLLGYTRDEIRNINFTELLNAEQSQHASEVFLEIMETGFQKTLTEFKLHLKKGNEIYIESQGSAIISNGVYTAIHTVARNITQQKSNEAKLKEALLKAESGNRLKSAFIYNISYAVRTPLNGILGFSQLITQPDLTDEEKDQFYTLIKASSNRLINTVSSYIDISLITSGNMEVNRKPFDLHKILYQLKEQFEPLCSVKNIILRLNIPKKTSEITFHSNYELLQKALSNLLDNAVKFTSRGEITFGYIIKPGRLEFFIKDNGIGISKEAQSRIFENFVQEELLHTRGYEGNGLGLSIAQGIVRLLGGEIRVESEKGAGSTFIFDIPYEDFGEEIKTTGLKEQKVSIPDKHVVLIAEDDGISRFYLKRLLSIDSIEVLLVANGKEAVEQCRSNSEISLVLMDLKMPVMDGFEAFQEIKAFRKELPIIAITALAMSSDEKKVLELGFDDYLSKPVSKEALTEKLKKYGITK